MIQLLLLFVSVTAFANPFVAALSSHRRPCCDPPGGGGAGGQGGWITIAASNSASVTPVIIANRAGNRIIVSPRKGTAEEWDKANPVLEIGEIGFVTPYGPGAPQEVLVKIGDGKTPWRKLAYLEKPSPLTDSEIAVLRRVIARERERK